MQVSINTSLRKIGIKKNDVIIIHSSFRRLSRNGFMAEKFLNMIQSYLNQGTLIFPTLTWKTVKKTKKFDYLKNSSEVGILSEIFRKKYKKNRSFHPTHSIVVSGKKQNEILNYEKKNNFYSPCGKGTVWEKMIKLNTKIILIDTFIDSCTLVHFFEEYYNPNYFLEKKITKYYCTNEYKNKKIIKLRNHSAGKRSFNQIFFELKKRNLLKQTYLKDSSILSFSSSNLKKVSQYLFSKDKKASI